MEDKDFSTEGFSLVKELQKMAAQREEKAYCAQSLGFIELGKEADKDAHLLYTIADQMTSLIIDKVKSDFALVQEVSHIIVKAALAGAALAVPHYKVGDRVIVISGAFKGDIKTLKPGHMADGWWCVEEGRISFKEEEICHLPEKEDNNE